LELTRPGSQPPPPHSFVPGFAQALLPLGVRRVAAALQWLQAGGCSVPPGAMGPLAQGVPGDLGAPPRRPRPPVSPVGLAPRRLPHPAAARCVPSQPPRPLPPPGLRAGGAGWVFAGGWCPCLEALPRGVLARLHARGIELGCRSRAWPCVVLACRVSRSRLLSPVPGPGARSPLVGVGRACSVFSSAALACSVLRPCF